ncbi:MAG TPA: glycosyltransferase [Micromonosporaceae bacterium]
MITDAPVVTDTAMTADALIDPRELPDVSIVIPLADAAATLPACLDSVLGQTIGADHIEIVLIGTATGRLGRALKRFARRHPGRIRLIDELADQRPAAVRNRGIDEARGRYLMFLDGSRKLAPSALEKMVKAADRHESDVVLGGDAAATADVFTGTAYWSLSANKIYRAELLNRRDLRFPVEAASGDIEEFTAAAYIAADFVSAVPDPGTITPIDARSDTEPAAPVDRIESAARMMAYVAATLPPGAERDHLMLRHIEVDLGDATGAAMMPESEARRLDILERARELLSRYLTPEIRTKLPAPMAIRFALIERGQHAAAQRMAGRKPDAKPPKKVIENGRVYAAYPFFRDPEIGVPDEAYDITDELTITQELEDVSWKGATCTLTGYAFFEELSTRKRSTKLVLRERRSGTEHRFHVTSLPRSDQLNKLGKPRSMSGFQCRLNLRQTGDGYPIKPGLWDVYLSVGFEGVNREVRIGRQRSATVDTTARRSVLVSASSVADGHEIVATPYYTEHDNLTFEVSSRLPLS